ncbi:MAG: FtsX-like permease family protein [Candidatus Eisenbacteria bacterium]|uniref:FtsX-like permease family protein n=1 Tax=Eiseniibacteriota bacterium TaxID=2212470 RepID=A0A849SML2_UNCEI|nr:FtsX-like permease family protein [Candidatus Eisenbacteria bacterium]
MIAHYLKLVWNRRRANTLILVEILASFLVLCAIFGVVAYYATNWRRPLGFEYRDLWTVDVDIPQATLDDREANARALATSQRLLAIMNGTPQVTTAAPMPNMPYSGSISSTGVTLADGSLMQFLSNPTTPAGFDALKLELVAGRWIEPGDDALEFTPQVITLNMARRLFGRENPIGRTIDNYKDGQLEAPDKGWQERRVVGVIRTYRNGGEFNDVPYAAFRPQSMTDIDRGWVPWSYVIRASPGARATFEETLLKSLHAEAPEWTFTLHSAELERQRYIRGRLLPLAFGGTLAGFLILMVGMGLMGVLWQNVTSRTQELGLRRALGATASAVRNQIIGEIVVLTTIALFIGSALFLQLLLIGALASAGVGVFVSAIVASILVIVPFVIVCALYPGWLATQMEPSRALQYE